MIKHIITAFTCAAFALSVNAQKPEPVYGPARIEKPISWYKDQSAAWKKEIDKNPKDATAWYNYYYAQRVISYHDAGDKRSQEQKTADIKKLMDDMGKNIPDTYEYNLCVWAVGGFDNSLLPYLKKAAELGPDRTEHLDFMINIGETSRNTSDRDKYSLRKYETGNVSGGMLYYNYNVLAGLAPDAILVTCGDNDTYPVWVLQAMGIRRDVKVINVSLAMVDEYRQKLFAELGISPMDPANGKDPRVIDAYYKNFRNNLISHLVSNKKKLPVYLALTTAFEPYADTVQEHLYLTGLAYQYNSNPMDNMAQLRKNFEQQYALDYLDRSFFNDISADKVKIINTNYIVPMLKLYDHYVSAGDVLKQEWIKQKILLVSKGSESESEIKQHLSKQ